MIWRRSRPAAIVAASQIPADRYPDSDGMGLLERIVGQFLNEWPSVSRDMIDGLLVPPATIYGTQGTNTYIHQRLAGRLGLQPKFAETLNAGATYGAMIARAVMAVEAGACEAVLCVGVGKFPSVRLSGPALATLVGDPDFEFTYGASIPAMYALIAQRFMHLRGTTRRQLSAVAVSARDWSLSNPDAFMRESGPLTHDEVAESRPIALPFRKLDCSVPCEGGGAVLVTAAKAIGRAEHAAYVVGIGEHHNHAYLSELAEPTETGVSVSARRAFEMAGRTPKHIDIAQLYDAFTITPIIQAEEMGLVARGEGGAFFESGAAGPGGTLPINTFGGLLSFGHTGDASGMAFVIEGARQVMGCAGRRQLGGVGTALVHTYGGIMADHATLILSREP